MTDGRQEAELHDLSGITDTTVHELGTRPVRIGRIGIPDAVSGFIAIHRGTISRHHATISWQDGHFVIEDADTTNGTFVNGEAVKDTPRVLKDGDLVRFDVFEFEFKQKRD